MLVASGARTWSPSLEQIVFWLSLIRRVWVLARRASHRNEEHFIWSTVRSSFFQGAAEGTRSFIAAYSPHCSPSAGVPVSASSMSAVGLWSSAENTVGDGVWRCWLTSLSGGLLALAAPAAIAANCPAKSVAAAPSSASDAPDARGVSVRWFSEWLKVDSPSHAPLHECSGSRPATQHTAHSTRPRSVRTCPNQSGRGQADRWKELPARRRTLLTVFLVGEPGNIFSMRMRNSWLRIGSTWSPRGPSDMHSNV